MWEGEKEREKDEGEKCVDQNGGEQEKVGYCSSYIHGGSVWIDGLL